VAGHGVGIGMGIPRGASYSTRTHTRSYTHTRKRGMGQRTYCEFGTRIDTHYGYTLGYSNASEIFVMYKKNNYATATPHQSRPIHPQVYPHRL